MNAKMKQGKSLSSLDAFFSRVKQTLEPKSTSVARRRSLYKWDELGKSVNGVPFMLAKALPRMPETRAIYSGNEHLLLPAMHWCDVAAQHLHKRLRAGDDFGAAFDSVVSALREHIISPTGRWMRIIILNGVHYKGRPVEIAPGVNISQLDSMQDVRKLIGVQNIKWPIEAGFGWRCCWTAIVCKNEISKRDHINISIPLEFGLTYDQLSNLLLAFRLYSDGEVTIPGEVIASLDTIPFFEPMVLPKGVAIDRSWELSPYEFGIELHSSDLKRIIEIYCQTKRLKEDKTFEEAKYRFGRSFESIGIMDAILELTICLEALSRLGGAELSYRIANRWASLLALPVDKIRSIHEAISSMYSIRSAVVHGSVKNISNHLSTLSGMKHRSPKQTFRVRYLGKEVEISVQEDDERFRRALLTARQIARLAFLAVLCLAQYKDKYRWPFPEDTDFDLELLDSTSREVWRKRAGVLKRDVARMWWSWEGKDANHI